METRRQDQIQILLIDDDPDDVVLTQDLLAQVDGLNAHVSWVPTYEKGLEEILSGRFDICLADYRLGRRDGVELLREATASGCGTPIILLTGQGARDVDLQAMQAGAADFLVKGKTSIGQFERSIRYARERKQAEDRLRQSERRYRAVYDATFQFLAVVSTDGSVLEANQTALDFGGLTKQSVLGTLFWECGWWGNADDEREQAKSAIRTASEGAPVRYETHVRSSDGTVRTVDFAVKPAFDERGSVEFIVAEGHDLTRQREAQERVEALNRDLEKRVQSRTAELVQKNALLAREIAERRSIQDALVRARDEAEAANRAKSAFLANMSHDIRTPLTSIIGYSDVLADGASAHDREIARLIRASSQRLMHTLESVLDLARLEGRQYQLRRTTLDLCGEAREVSQLFESQARDLRLKLSVDCNGEAVWAEVDRAALSRVLTNVIGNALKYTDGGAVTVKVMPRMEEAVVSVEDTGIGISEEFLPHIFDVFQQERRDETSSRQGSGLGLAITRQLVELMGGKIEVMSEVGVGTKVELSFPLRDRPEDVSYADDSLVQSPSMAGGLVLLVEDDDDTRRLLRRLLEDDFEVIEAANTRDAVASLDGRPFRFFLVDINLGKGRTGVDLMRTVRSMPEYADVPVIACTAYALPGNREMLLNMGFDDYLSKPFSREHLRQALNRLLQS